MKSFIYKAQEFDYIDHPHNSTRANERCVEVALAKKLLEQYKNVVEIGAVTPYYFEEYTHDVYDLEDKHPRAINIDASELNITGKNVVCLSTIEHFKKCSVEFIENVMNNANKYLITFPLGYNERIDAEEKLDKWALNHAVSFMTRDGDEWIQIDTPTDEQKKYTPKNWANTVCIIENYL